MIELEHFEKYLNSITKEEWKGLFILIPEIESTDTFGIIEQESPLFFKVKNTEIVDRVMLVLESMKLFPLFEWIAWKDGQKRINDPQVDLSQFTTKENCMLLTVIFRLDKFNEGFLVSKFEDGTMLRIIKALQLKMDRIS